MNEPHRQIRIGLSYWLVALLALSGCSGEVPGQLEEVTSAVPAAFGQWIDASNQSCLENRIIAPRTFTIRLHGEFVTSANRAALQNQIRTALVAWIDGIRPISKVPLITGNDVMFTSATTADLDAEWTSTDERCTGNPGAIKLHGAVSQHVVLHEIGHAFCLNDTYVEGGSACVPGQEASAMCEMHGWPTTPMNDDLQGVRSIFCQAYPDRCTSQRQGNPVSPFCQQLFGITGRVRLGDFNRDGRADLLCRGPLGNLNVSHVDNNGIFQSVNWTSSGFATFAAAYPGDFNGDGRDDLLLFNPDSGTRSVLYATNAGDLSGMPTQLPAPWCAGSSVRLLVGDFDGDRWSDMLCQASSNGSIWVDYSGTGKQDSSNTTWGWCSGSAKPMLAGDFNGDGRDDLLCANPSSQTFQVALADQQGRFSALQPVQTVNTLWTWDSTWELHAGRFNGDNRADVLARNRVDGSYLMAFAEAGAGFPGWSRGWRMPWCTGSGTTLLAGDLTGDGVMDMVCHNSAAGTVDTWYNGSAGPADFNFDGKADILWHNSSSGLLRVWHMDGAARIGITDLAEQVGGGFRIAAIDDFDGDGQADLLLHNANTGELQLSFMSAANHTHADSFDPSLWKKESDGFKVSGAGDFNDDGKADILWRKGADGEMWVWYMDGKLMKGSPVKLDSSLYYNDSSGWRIVGVSDFDRDGKVDMLWRNVNDGDMWVWYMDGVTLRAPLQLPSSLRYGDNTGWRIVGTRDFSGDRKPDILWFNVDTTSQYYRKTYIWSMDWRTDAVVQLASPQVDTSLASAGWSIVDD